MLTGGTGVWTAGTGVYRVVVTMVGGGGCGQASQAGGFNAGTGGNAGELVLNQPYPVEPGIGYQYQVGTGASGGTGVTNGQTGQRRPGSVTIFGGLVAQPGQGNVTQPAGGGPMGGTAPSGSGQSIGFPGTPESVSYCGGGGGGQGCVSGGCSGGSGATAPGWQASTGDAVGSNSGGGGGASTIFGRGGSGASGAQQGPAPPATAYGAGGGGGAETSVGYTKGGDGANGVIILMW
jgi:hypothetical protein